MVSNLNKFIITFDIFQILSFGSTSKQGYRLNCVTVIAPTSSRSRRRNTLSANASKGLPNNLASNNDIPKMSSETVSQLSEVNQYKVWSPSEEAFASLVALEIISWGNWMGCEVVAVWEILEDQDSSPQKRLRNTGSTETGLRKGLRFTL